VQRRIIKGTCSTPPPSPHPPLPLPQLCAEKNLGAIKGIMEQVPGTRLAFVGDGPSRQELEATFAGLPVVFMVRCWAA